jgi:thiamine kinase-like enzyme
MFPECSNDLYNSLNALSNNMPDDLPETVFSHRDFFDKQLLYSERRSTLLDCDNAAKADPALDVGNFIAHLTLRKLQHPNCSANIEKGIRAFIESYGNLDDRSRLRTAWWTKASLLRLSALYLLRPRWRTIAPDLINQPINLFGHQAYGGVYDI